jgi:hypothetical protein
MSYHVNITRKGHWAMPDGPLITADEWLSYIATDPQLKRIPGSHSHGVTVDIQSQYSAKDLDWSPHSGSIWANKPDVAMLAKMLQIASALRAKVQGVDGEVYGVADLHDGFVAGKSVRGLDLNEPQNTA